MTTSDAHEAPHLTFSNGDTMPALGLGTWKSAPGEVGAAVREALSAGYRHIDCAAVYGNEAEVGEALDASCAAGEITRDDVWITSKLWSDSHLPDDVVPALRKTLADLRLDHLDLYLIHWPVAYRKGLKFPKNAEHFHADLPIEDTWSAMEDAVERGLCRHIGVSNFSPALLERLLEQGSVGPEVLQVELHPYLQQDDLVAFCRARGIHLTAYSPLGSPDRPENMKGQSEPTLLDNETIKAIAARHDATPAQVLIRWALERGTSVIPKSTNPRRIRENLAAASLRLDEADMEQIAAHDLGFRYVDGSFWERVGSPLSAREIFEGPAG